MALTAISSGQTVTGPIISPRDVVDDCGVMSQANVVSERSRHVERRRRARFGLGAAD